MIRDYFLLALIGFLFRALYYARRYSFLKDVHKLYFKYLDVVAASQKSAGKSTKKQGSLYRSLLEKQQVTKQYIMEAGLENPSLTSAEPICYGVINPRDFHVLDNITQHSTKIADIFNQTIQRAMGYYKHMRNESLNPILWPEYIVLKFPKSLISKVIEIVKSALTK